MGIDEIIAGLNWFAHFQVNHMKKRKKREGHNKVFIEKLTSEINQTQVVIYREFNKHKNKSKKGKQAAQQENDDNMVEQFNALSLPVLCQLLGTFMPIAKLSKQDSYLIGTEVKQMMVRGENCMIRVGGGFEDIKAYYNNYATKQCVSLYQRMRSSNSTFKEALLDLLGKNSATPEVIEAYRAEPDTDWQTANDLFILLSNIVEEKTNDLTQARKNSSPKKLK